jgi:hypothetical protein
MPECMEDYAKEAEAALLDKENKPEDLKAQKIDKSLLF